MAHGVGASKPHQRLFTPILIFRVAAPVFHAMDRTTEAKYMIGLPTTVALDGALQTLGHLLRLQITMGDIFYS